MEIIAEIGNSHEGSLGVAKSFVCMLKNVGVKVVKFQMHLAEYEGTKDEPFRVAFSDQDSSRQEYWKRVNFSEADWLKLSKFCQENDMEFLCSVFSVEAAQFCYDNNLVKRWKVGSGNALDWPLLEYLVSTGLPMLISTGLIAPDEIDELKQYLCSNAADVRTTLMHCVSRYPVPLSEIDLPLMLDLSSENFAVGYSDHSGTVHPALYALSIGAQVIEVHMTPRYDYFGPDVSSSLTPEDIKLLVDYSEGLATLKRSTGTKHDHFDRVRDLRYLFRRGIYWRTNLKEGDRVSRENLIFLKPVRGVDVADLSKVVGKILIKAVEADTPVQFSELSG